MQEMLEQMDKFFTTRVQGYDEHMRNEVERGSSFYEFTALQLPPAGNANILDLGCGTGLELEAYYSINPHAKITGIDLTQAMLNVLKSKFPDKDITLICGSYFDVPFGEEVFDAAVSVESLHHFSGEEKASLYTRLRSALKPGGCFILTDYFADLEEQEVFFRQEMLRLRKEQHLPDDVFYHYDTPLTVKHEKEILYSVGFASVEELNRWEATHTLKAVK